MTSTETTSLEMADDAARNCACFQVRKLARLVTRSYDEALSHTGLKSTQFSMLAAIVRASDGLSLSDLAKRLGMERSTFSRNLSPLVKRGLVEHLDTLKGRSRNIRATSAGKQVFVEAVPAWRNAQEALHRKFESADRADFLDDLSTVAGNLQI